MITQVKKHSYFTHHLLWHVKAGPTKIPAESRTPYIDE